MTYRVGFIGTGRVAAHHHQALVVAGAELVGVYDPDQQRAATAAAQWDAEPAGSVIDLVARADIDLVYVLSPAAYHVEHAVAALRHGKHVLVEKPVSSNVEEIRRLHETAVANQVSCVPGHNALHVPELARIRRLVDTGALGQVTHLDIVESYRMPDQLAARYGGPLDEVLIHHVYLALYLLGRPTHVVAMAANPIHGLRVAPQQLSVLLTWPGEILGHLYQSWAANDHAENPATFRLKLLGDAGGGSYSRRSVTGPPEDSGNPSTPVYQELFDNQTRFLLHDHLTQATTPPSTLQDAADAAAVITAVRDTLEDHQVSSPFYVDLGHTP